MNDLLREKLCELLAAHGRPLVDDRARCEALLWLAAGEDSRGMFYLTGALERKVPQALLTAPPERRDEALLAKLTRRLVDDLDMDEGAARWAVECWAQAVAGAPAQPLVPPEPRPPEPPPAPTRHAPRPVPAAPPELAALPALALDEGVSPVPVPREVSSVSLDRFFAGREPEGTFLQGGTEGVTCLACSPDGATLATGHEDGTVKLWDAHTGQPRGSLTGHEGRVNALAFAPCRRRLASAGADGTVRLWDPDTGREQAVLDGHDGPVLCLAFSPDGRGLASGGADTSVRLWDADEGTFRRSLKGHDREVACLAWCPYSGTTVASGGLDGLVRLWDLKFGSYRATLSGHAGGVTALAYAPDGELLLSGGEDWSVRLWNAVTAGAVAAFEGTSEGHTRPVRAVAFAPNGWTAASAGDDETVRVWDVTARRELCAFAGHTGAVRGLAFSADGHWLASAGADGVVRRWRAPEAERPAPPRRLARPRARASSALKAGAFCVALVVVVCLLIHLVSRLGGSSSRRPRPGWGDRGRGAQAEVALAGHTDGVAAVAVTPDGSRALSGSFDKSVRLWDLNTRQELRRLDGHTGPVLAVAVSPDGQRALSGGLDKTVRLWDLNTGQELRRLQGFGGVTCVAFSPDGKRIAVGCGFEKVTHTVKNEPGQPQTASMRWERTGKWDDRLTVWDTETGRKLYALVGHPDEVTCLAFTPDGERLLSGSFDKTVSLWDLKTRKEIRRFRGHTGEVFGLAVSRDGKRLLSCSGTLGPALEKEKDKQKGEKGPAPQPKPEPKEKAEPDPTVRLWDLETGKELRVFRGHTNAVFAVAFSPDGQQALSGSFDTTLRLWDVEGGQELDRSLSHQAAVTCVAFTPDGLRAVSGGWDNKVRVRRLP
jgi:WD40 repeat protein